MMASIQGGLVLTKLLMIWRGLASEARQERVIQTLTEERSQRKMHFESEKL